MLRLVYSFAVRSSIMAWAKKPKATVRRRVSKTRSVKFTPSMARTVRSLKKEMVSETRFLVGTPSLTPADPAVASMDVLNTCSPGDTVATREGTEISMKQLSMNFAFTQIALAFGICMRCIVLLDKKPAGALPTTADSTTVPGVLALANFNSVISERGKSRFHILMDEIYSLPGQMSPAINLTFTAGVPLVDVLPSRRKRFNLKGARAKYNTVNNGNITDLIENSLIVFFLPSDASTAWTVSYDWGLTFNP